VSAWPWRERHQHCWNVIARNYTPPSDRGVKTRGDYRDLADKLLLGFTVTTFRCTGCGWEESTTDIGDTRPAEVSP
jgi:hypothetical protein